MSVESDIAAFAIGQIAADELPSLAAQWVKSGYNSASLERLATAHNLSTPEVRDLFFAAVNELGYSVPSLNNAGMILARHIAGEVLSHALTPYDGAKRIWTQIYLRLPSLKQLGPFVGLAAAYEDDMERAESYSRQILRHCEILVSASRTHVVH